MPSPLELPPADVKSAPPGLKPRSPLRVWVNFSPEVYGGDREHWVVYCDECFMSETQWDWSLCAETRGEAIAFAEDHSHRCPALRLARLEAELESLSNQLRGRIDELAETGRARRGKWLDADSYFDRASAYCTANTWLSDILTRHRGQS